jgi:hypothetical protein
VQDCLQRRSFFIWRATSDAVAATAEIQLVVAWIQSVMTVASGILQSVAYSSGIDRRESSSDSCASHATCAVYEL